jgi:hypothetical protein
MNAQKMNYFLFYEKEDKIFLSANYFGEDEKNIYVLCDEKTFLEIA